MGCTTVAGLKFGKDCNKPNEADVLLGQAALEQAKKQQVQPKEWTPLQIFGVVGGSLLAITLMTVILIKVKKAK